MILLVLSTSSAVLGQVEPDSLLRAGRKAYQSGDYSIAIESYRSYLSLAKQDGDDRAIADAYRLLGDAFRGSRDFDEALTELAAGLKIATRIGDSALVGRIQDRVAAVYFELNDLPKTEKAANIALKLSKSAGDSTTIASSLNILGAAYRGMKQFPKALNTFYQASDLLYATGDTTDVPNILNNIAHLHQDMRNFDAAIDTALHSYAMASAMGIVPYEEFASQILFTSYHHKGDLDKTVEWMQKFMNHVTERNTLEHARELASLRMKMETERQEQENEHLKTENALHLQTIANQNGRFLAIAGAVVFAMILVIVLGVVARRQRNHVTRLREQNQQIEQQSAEINNYNARLQVVAQEREENQRRLMEMHGVKDKLFSIISHDLRSPLNSIQGMLGLFEGGLIDQVKFASMAERLKTRVDGTTLLLDNLLNWSRSQMEGFVVERDILDLGSMINQECTMQATGANAKQIQLENTVPVGTNAMGDKSMVELVVRNLISNAIKFTGNGGRIVAKWKSQGDHIHIGICDDGVGIPPQLVEKILGPEFFSTIGTAHEKGSGLGLRLCRDFLRQNGGDLWLTHNENRGTTFWFSLHVNETFPVAGEPAPRIRPI